MPDRVQLDPGTVYTLSQTSQGAVITINVPGGPYQLTLDGVQAASLPAGSIFGA